MWEVHDLLLALEKDAPREVTIPVEQGDHLIVLVEDPEGRCEAETENLPETHSARTEQATVIVGETLSGGNIVLRLTRRVSGWVRVRIGRLIRRLRSAAGKLRCRACKELVLLVASALLADLGVSLVADRAVDLSAFGEDRIGAALDRILPGSATELGLASVIRTVLRGLAWVLEVKDAFAEKVCGVLGACP